MSASESAIRCQNNSCLMHMKMHRTRKLSRVASVCYSFQFSILTVCHQTARFYSFAIYNNDRFIIMLVILLACHQNGMEFGKYVGDILLLI